MATTTVMGAVRGHLLQVDVEQSLADGIELQIADDCHPRRTVSPGRVRLTSCVEPACPWMILRTARGSTLIASDVAPP